MNSAEQLSVSVVIVSFNTRRMTLRCLAAIKPELAARRAEIFVVDNGSNDGSAAAVRAAFPEVQVISEEKNIGFGAANNHAMRMARGEFILLLNSDAFVRSGAVENLLAYLEANPKFAAVGPRLVNADGSLQASCFRFPSPARVWCENLGFSRLFPNHGIFGDYSRWKHDHPRRVEFVSGACMLVRRSVVKEIGGFDESFFLYAEETDWQRRMRNASWDIGFTPAATVMHIGGASGRDTPAQINRHFFESLHRYELKHHGVAGLLSLRCAMSIGCSLRAVLWGLAALLPGRRKLAWAKFRLHGWLLSRQLLGWHLPQKLPHT
ncbi:MAG: glycosyltransferase family 2 protein [Verrucomicrobia bacterium]|nr:glycosyltransferase family 2 protein [Verrucomicrobiota bacterium]